MQQRDVLLAAIIAAHGLKGEVKVKTFTARPENLGAYGPLHDKNGRLYTVTSLKPGKNGEAQVAFAEIATRDSAEAARGVELFVARAALPAAEADEFYHADLLGLDAEDKEGRRIGKVHAIQNYGAGDVLVLMSDSGEEIWLAFTRETVPEIDIANKRLIIAIPDEIEARPAHDME